MYRFNQRTLFLLEFSLLIANVTMDESNKWHRRLGHVNFKNINKLVKGNLVRGLPSKIFQNDHTCVACQNGKQHKASCKAKSSVSLLVSPTLLAYGFYFGHQLYLGVFLRTKDETSGILKDFIRQIENQLNQNFKSIRCDNGTEFKNRDFIEFCGSKGIKREYSNARTPQQNRVAGRKKTGPVIEAYLVTKPQNKTPYELITGKISIISYIRPFGCHMTILNTINHLGKFDGKSDEGFLVGYSLQSKAFRGKEPIFGCFDLDYLTDSMNYQPVRYQESRLNKHAGSVVVRNKARIKATRIFLAFASYMGFIVYQVDVKSAFLYSKIEEEVYVSQPIGRGTIDKTLFIKKDKNDIMLVKVYVDDIIFGSTKKSWCDEFETLMKSRFQMSSMVELTFFLGLQVKQKKDGIFISLDKYVAEILKKFDLVNVKTASTPIKTHKPLVKDEEASDVDVHLYRSMIDSLMYLTASRPDIMFAVCACSRFQVTPIRPPIRSAG
ncbi:putative ribonuclease H-like domain-containing protein [Tanacetum coccineum]